MKESKIEWTDHTFNPWIGCTKVSPGCKHCYAEHSGPVRVARAAGRELWGAGAERQRTGAKYWQEPLRWQSAFMKADFAWRLERDELLAAGSVIQRDRPRRPRVFCASLADWLDEEVPVAWLADLLGLIHATPHLDWLLLTKRPGNWGNRIDQVLDWSAEAGNEAWRAQHTQWLWNWRFTMAWPYNVWIGTTVEDQLRAEERVPLLLRIPARVRFLSVEPLLGALDIVGLTTDPPHSGMAVTDGWGRFDGEGEPEIHWVICGGESGPQARPMHPDWARGVRDQCVAAGVPFFFKQWGEWHPCPIGDGPEMVTDQVFKKGPGLDGAVWRVGKKAAGRLLDGREWNELPQGPAAAPPEGGTPTERLKGADSGQ